MYLKQLGTFIFPLSYLTYLIVQKKKKHFKQVYFSFLFTGKLAGVDKKLYKHLEGQWNSDSSESVSPDHNHSLHDIISPFGPMNQPSSRRMLFNLIATLNASYPDYDFSDVKPDQFTKHQSAAMVCNYINNTLFNLGHAHIINNLALWKVIEDIIELDECSVYSFNPDNDSDPNAEDGAI